MTAPSDKPKKTYCFEVREDHLEGFVCSLVLGTLYAMRSEVWPLGAGIWALGRPNFWGSLERAGISGDLVALLQEADELSALAELSGRTAADARLEELIAQAGQLAARTSAQLWQAKAKVQE
jgi:hypothetical protein